MSVYSLNEVIIILWWFFRIILLTVNQHCLSSYLLISFSYFENFTLCLQIAPKETGQGYLNIQFSVYPHSGACDPSFHTLGVQPGALAVKMYHPG